MRLPPETRKRLNHELGQLRHMTRAERRIWAAVRKDGNVDPADVRELEADFESLPSATPTPTEAELIRIVRANAR